ncbi:MFS transporter [Aquihabitans sp. McL0605]|uniref:MFS transporter n=1 Tax=Aquihabitans sp. McL0605 TaxID=3415671 RepID=UPI003CFA7B1F
MPKLLVDITPLKASREFRLLYGGQVVSFIGTQMTAVTAPYQVYKITGSSFMVGLLGLAVVVPLIVGSLVGGALADQYDRRRLLLLAQFLIGATSLGLALNAMSSAPKVWLIFGLVMLQQAFSGLDVPTRSAAIPKLVGAEHLPAAAALNQLLMQVGTVVGPAIGGLLIAKVSLASTYWIDFASFGIAIAALVAMKPMLPQGGGTKASLGSIVEGLRFLKGRQALQGSFVIDLNAMIFGMPRALFPAIGTAFGGAFAVGLLYAAPGAGAIVGAVTSGWVTRIDRQGRATVIAVIVWGASIAAFGLSKVLALSLVLLAAAGAADVVSAVFRNTIMQLSVPDRLRGRLSSVHIAVVTGGPRLGDFESGAVAGLTSPQFAVVSGGMACVVGAVAIGRLMPRFTGWRLHEHGDPDALDLELTDEMNDELGR